METVHENKAGDKFDRPNGLPVDICIFTIQSEDKRSPVKSLPKKELKILLIQRRTFDEPREDYAYQGYWALPGGFSKREESLEEAALRELKEETNVGEDVHIEQLKTVYYPGRDPRGWIPSVVHFALVKEDYLKQMQGGDDAAEAKLFTVEEALSMKLAFDHSDILKEAVQKVREKMLTTTIAKEFLGEEFTINELFQLIKTVVPEFNVDKGNFVKKMVSSKRRKGLLEEVVGKSGEPKKSDQYSQRAAQLYRYSGAEPTPSIYNFNLMD